MTIRGAVFGLLTAVLCSLALAGGAVAADVIYTPTGRAADGVVADVYFGSHDAGIVKLAAGLGGFELNLSNYRTPGLDLSRLVRDDATVYGFSCQLLPETPVTPSLCIGAKDMTNKLREGTTFFGVVGKELTFLDRSGFFSRIYASAGFGSCTLKKAFGSVSLEIKDRVYVDGEMYNGGSSWGAGIRFNDMFRAGYLRFDGRDYGGIRFALEF
ncbi:MAG: hypothetical protein IK083_09665 [Abditibacteriota bacterium]|nr:hypothetical protein [Abditibacteriota bacterium]